MLERKFSSLLSIVKKPETCLIRYETYTSPAVVVFGIAMALVFVVPLGLINAVTGVQVTMNVMAELIGGAISPGNALAMNYFKVILLYSICEFSSRADELFFPQMYGYITTAQA